MTHTDTDTHTTQGKEFKITPPWRMLGSVVWLSDGGAAEQGSRQKSYQTTPAV